MKKPSTLPVGMSVPMRQVADKNARIPSLDGKVKYQVFGEGIMRDTWIYFYPKQLSAKIAKYKKLKQWLFGPITDEGFYTMPASLQTQQKHADPV